MCASEKTNQIVEKYNNNKINWHMCLIHDDNLIAPILLFVTFS